MKILILILNMKISKNGRSNLMPDKESIYLYKFCDLVCVPSIIEGMGNVGAEA